MRNGERDAESIDEDEVGCTLVFVPISPMYQPMAALAVLAGLNGKRFSGTCECYIRPEVRDGEYLMAVALDNGSEGNGLSESWWSSFVALWPTLARAMRTFACAARRASSPRLARCGSPSCTLAPPGSREGGQRGSSTRTGRTRTRRLPACAGGFAIRKLRRYICRGRVQTEFRHPLPGSYGGGRIARHLTWSAFSAG